MSNATMQETKAPAQAVGAATVESGEPETARKIAIICSKGSLDMAYPGLILANAARMMGIEAVLFFTFWGLDVVTEKKVDHLHADLVGNPANPMPTWIQGFPGMEALGSKMMKKKIEELDIPDVREMLETLDDAGAEIYACQMAMEMFGRERDDLVPQVQAVISAMDFFDKAEGAQTIFI
ncbi:MAG: DsrE/DsrF/DrsH-like family protein [Gemmatimonadota bacterium]